MGTVACGGAIVRLRFLAEDDLEFLRLLRNDVRTRMWFADDTIIDPAAQAAWFARYRARDNDYLFIIERAAVPYASVGAVSIYDVDRTSATAEFGRLMIDPEQRGHGLGMAATAMACEWAWSALSLSRLTLWVRGDNVPAITLYCKVGFVEEAPSLQRAAMRFFARRCPSSRLG